METTKTLFEMVCCEGNKIFGYTLIENNISVKYEKKPYLNNKNVEIKQSHGYCKGCLPQVYNKCGLIPKYSEVKK